MGSDQFTVWRCVFSLLDLKKERASFLSALSIQCNVYSTRLSTAHEYFRRHLNYLKAKTDLVLARQYSDDIRDPVVLDADGAGLREVLHLQIVLLEHRRRDDGQRALGLAAKLPLQAVLGVDVPARHQFFFHIVPTLFFNPNHS